MSAFWGLVDEYGHAALCIAWLSVTPVAWLSAEWTVRKIQAEREQKKRRPGQGS